MKAGAKFSLIGYWLLIVAFVVRDIGKTYCEVAYQFTPANALSVVIVATMTLLVGYCVGKAQS